MAQARRRYVVFLVLAAVPFLVAACGGSGPDSPAEATPASEEAAGGVPALPAPTEGSNLASEGTSDAGSASPSTGATTGSEETGDVTGTSPSVTESTGGETSLAPVPIEDDKEVKRAQRRFPSYWQTDFSKRSISYSEVIAGGPARDGIPPIYDPQFETVEQANQWMLELEPVIVVQINGDVRAYSQSLLMFHEVVDDVVGGRPIVVSWCPLCNTSVVNGREIDGKVFTFGVSGLLRHSDLIMWDHETESWWQQGTSEAIVGAMTGTKLELIPSQVVTWRDFKAAFPEGKVLSKVGSTHGRNPYFGYDTSYPFLFDGPVDDRLEMLERIVGIRLGGEIRAYPYEELAKDRVVQESVGGQSLVIFYEPSGLSPLDAGDLARSANIGTAAVFEPTAGERELTFEFRDGELFDKETGSRWNILGQAVEGALKGESLPPVFHTQAFWFFWAASFGDTTTIYSSNG